MGLKVVLNARGVRKEVCTLADIDKVDARYKIIVSGRSDGKSFAVCEEKILKNYFDRGERAVIFRRYEENFKQGRGRKMWNNLVQEKKIQKYGFDQIVFKSMGWYLGRWDEDLNKTVTEPEPFCYAVALSTWELNKSCGDDNRVTTLFMDEFITRDFYLSDEFIKFMNAHNSIVRFRPGVTTYLCANTTNWDNPYFREFGINGRKLEQGKIAVFKFGEKGTTKVAVEYLAPSRDEEKKKGVEEYYAFDNPKLKMITGGQWEVNIYPHLPHKFLPKDVRGIFFIKYEDYILQGEIVNSAWNEHFIYLHRKTTEIKDPDHDEIFCPDCDPRDNWHRSILSPDDDFAKVVYRYFVCDKVFYQDNEVGEMVRAYLKSCRDWSIIKA